LKLKSSEKKEKNEVELVIEVEPEELEAAVNKAYIKNRNRIAVPGFRKGKAPRKIIERMYGAEIFLSDALDEILPEALRFAIKETDLNVVGYPKVSDVDIKEDNSGAEVTLLAALHPEVVIGKYKGLKAQKPEVEVPESEIDNEVASVRTRNARIEKVDRPAANGDIAVIDFEGFVDNIAFEGGKGENYELELGSGQFIPGFEEKVEGMAVGEERDIDLVFPVNYKEDLAGKAVVFKVKLHEVKGKSLPELDDEFAKDVSEFDTLEEYKADIKDRLLKTRQQDVDETFENLLMDQLVESLEADIPDAMVDEQYDNSMNNLTRQISAYGMQPAQYMQMLGVTPEQFEERMRDTSKKQVKGMLALEKIAELEGIEISDEEVEEELKKSAERFNMELDKVKESIPQKEIIRDLKLRAAIKLVVENAIVEEHKEEPSGKDKPKKPAASSQKKSTTASKKAEKKPAAKKTETKKTTAKNKEGVEK